jgi:hypothetical protein
MILARLMSTHSVFSTLRVIHSYGRSSQSDLRAQVHDLQHKSTCLDIDRNLKELDSVSFNRNLSLLLFLDFVNLRVAIRS